MSDKAATILVVDDETPTRELIADLLEMWGYTVIQAGSGGEALAILADGLRPDLVISDFQMPGMNGADLVRAVKADYPGVAAVLASSVHPNELERTAREAGADGHLPKPFQLNYLQELLERLIPK